MSEKRLTGDRTGVCALYQCARSGYLEKRMQRRVEKLGERRSHQVGWTKITPPRAFPELGYERGRNIAEDSRQDPLPTSEIAPQTLVRLCGDRLS
jgi:hypothetical protein